MRDFFALRAERMVMVPLGVEFVVLNAVNLCYGVDNVERRKQFERPVDRHLVHAAEGAKNIGRAKHAIVRGEKLGDPRARLCPFVVGILQACADPVGCGHMEYLNTTQLHCQECRVDNPY